MLFLTFCILTGLSRPDSTAQAQAGQATVRPDPLVLELVPGEQGRVNILILDVQALYAGEFHLVFDPAVLEVVDADPEQAAVQVEPADWWKDGFVAVNRVDNAAGRIDFAATLLNPAGPVSGDQARSQRTPPSVVR